MRLSRLRGLLRSSLTRPRVLLAGLGLLIALYSCWSMSAAPPLVDEPSAKKARTDSAAATTMSAPAAAASSAPAPATAADFGTQDISLDVAPPSAVVPASALRSFVPYDAAVTHFPIQNLPYGVFTRNADAAPARKRIGVAIGDQVLDLSVCQQAGLFSSLPEGGAYFADELLNRFMEHEASVWAAARVILQDLLAAEGGSGRLRDNAGLRAAALVPQSAVTMHMPARVGDYTDFYSSKYHAYNVGVMFRGKANALQPNWTWLPVGYHGRASSIVVSGAEVTRPHGQLQPDESKPPVFGTCKLLDFELEMGAFVGGKGNALGQPLPMSAAASSIFGLVVLNDWSARDIQKWEYVPLGPFTAKNFATTISPWIVTMLALEPFAVPNQEQKPAPMPYLAQAKPMTYDIHLDVTLQSGSMAAPATISRSNAKYLYWTLQQQLVHHAVSGCPMVAGDLLGTGTISGPAPTEYGSMLELSWRGSKEVSLGAPENGVRKFLQDGDEVNMLGYAQADNFKVGFGDCKGKIKAAVNYP